MKLCRPFPCVIGDVSAPFSSRPEAKNVQNVESKVRHEPQMRCNYTWVARMYVRMALQFGFAAWSWAEMSSPVVKVRFPVCLTPLQLSIRPKPVSVIKPTVFNLVMCKICCPCLSCNPTSDRTKMAGKGVQRGSRDAQSLAEIVMYVLVHSNTLQIGRAMQTRHKGAFI